MSFTGEQRRLLFKLDFEGSALHVRQSGKLCLTHDTGIERRNIGTYSSNACILETRVQQFPGRRGLDCRGASRAIYRPRAKASYCT